MTDADITHTDVERLRAEVERARSDYLAVSRGAALFGDAGAHERAEERAWERLQAALDALAEADAPTARGLTGRT
jgi:hypothetical protein